MNIKHAFLLGCLIISGLVLNSCGGNNDPQAAGPKFQIFLDFWNTTGQTPEIKFDEQQTSREVKSIFLKHSAVLPKVPI